MRGDYFDDFMPWSVNSDSLRLRDRRDMINLGKENLLFLARFWAEHGKKMRAKADDPKTKFQDREKFNQDATDSAFKAQEIRKFAREAESKPCLFHGPAFGIGSRVACFLENPDRFVMGVITKIKTDTNDDSPDAIRHATFSIRIYERDGQRLIDYVPDGFTLTTAEDFEYFIAHPMFFRLCLNYRTQSRPFPDRDKVDRMIFCITGSFDPSDDAA